jgi:LL-diaminopimelate aminotransferase
LLRENDYLPDLDSVPDAIWPKVKMLVLNFPNSPTGRVAPPEFYADVVRRAREREFIVVQDAAHIMLTHEGPPRSFLQTPGAREVGVEIHSMSKGFDMIGWRLGWVCGNELIVRAFADVKDNSDSGQFMAIQRAAVVALDDQRIPQQIRAKYRRRLEKLVAALQQVGFACRLPGGTYFLYTPAPSGADGQPFTTAEDASQYLITQRGIVTVPWDDAGPHLRFSVTYEADSEAAEDELMRELVARLHGSSLKWS